MTLYEEEDSLYVGEIASLLEYEQYQILEVLNTLEIMGYVTRLKKNKFKLNV